MTTDDGQSTQQNYLPSVAVNSYEDPSLADMVLTYYHDVILTLLPRDKS